MPDAMIFVLGIIFIVAVIPYWLKLHYGVSKKNNKNKSNSSIDSKDLLPLKEMAEDLQKRITVLESILDSESPGWRKKYE